MKTSTAISLFVLTACGPRPVTAPHLLVIGDSISIGYTPYVAESLRGDITVTHPNDNCRYSAYTLQHVDEWIALQKPTVITWNNGIWDCTTATYSTPDEYEANLLLIAPKLKATGAKVYFITTTDIPVHADTTGYILGCEVERNEIARRVMADEAIEVVDLNAVALTIPELHTAVDTQDNVHFQNVGYQILGDAIVKAIRNEF